MLTISSRCSPESRMILAYSLRRSSEIGPSECEEAVLRVADLLGVRLGEGEFVLARTRVADVAQHRDAAHVMGDEPHLDVDVALALDIADAAAPHAHDHAALGRAARCVAGGLQENRAVAHMHADEQSVGGQGLGRRAEQRADLSADADHLRLGVEAQHHVAERRIDVERRGVAHVSRGRRRAAREPTRELRLKCHAPSPSPRGSLAAFVRSSGSSQPPLKVSLRDA
jgi:hypothetical protein